ADRAARVLIEDEAREGRPPRRTIWSALWPLGVEECQYARREEARIRRDGAPGSEGPTQASLRWSRQGSEEHVRFVVLQDPLAFFGVSPKPLTDRLHRHGFAGDLPLVDKEAPDRPVRPTVRAGIADATLAAVGEAQGPAPLDLHEKDVHWVPRPRELEAATGEPSRVDVGPPPVRHQPPSLDPPEEPLATKAGIECVETDLDQIVGQTQDRHAVLRARALVRLDDRLVVARHEASPLP